MEVIVNGQSRNVAAGLNLLDLIQSLDLDPSRVAVELDRRIIRKEEWTETSLYQGAQVEIVHFVGGG